jgi:hypothetical protein
MTMSTGWRTAYGVGLALFLFAIIFPFYWIFGVCFHGDA